ncbi:MAG: MarR family transcriptional regulator [Rhizobiales bacterium]|nr:MarR family transcriptional regulator [Hyphomicrobiales bacterium]OJY06237.1 MAG: hypothetical protein BGP07_01240 [Rhizobiales bacterium 63-22]
MPEVMSSDDLISHRLTLLLHRVVAVLIDGSATQFREDGLSIPAARTMVSLLEAGGEAPVGSVSEATSIDLSTTSHILRRLEKQGYVKRERDPEDNRVVIAFLTIEGKVVAKRCRQASLDHEAILTKSMAPADVATFKRLLVEAFDNAKDGFR